MKQYDVIIISIARFSIKYSNVVNIYHFVLNGHMFTSSYYCCKNQIVIYE
ncbi:hypothetical protein [Amphibacillus jilinensis]|nr:hypothetical protein [Amphibacillus jilinensis]